MKADHTLDAGLAVLLLFFALVVVTIWVLFFDKD